MTNLIVTLLLSISSIINSPSSVTVVIIDNDCGEEYIAWRKIKTSDLSIVGVKVNNNVIEHYMRNGEIVYVMSPKESIKWFSKYYSSIKLSTKNKVILFGRKSIELNYDEDFIESTKEVLGKPKIIIPYEGCNISILDEMHGC